jgi:hypothetical protein
MRRLQRDVHALQAQSTGLALRPRVQVRSTDLGALIARGAPMTERRLPRRRISTPSAIPSAADGIQRPAQAPPGATLSAGAERIRASWALAELTRLQLGTRRPRSELGAPR